MTAQNIAAASGALLMFNFGLYTYPTTFNYSINGNAGSSRSPLPPGPQPISKLTGQRSVALSIPLGYLVPGPQSIRLSSDADMIISNVNIVLVAAAPVPGFPSPATPANLRIVD